jgi:hypothetical protein
VSEPGPEVGANGQPLWNGYTCPRDRDLRASYGITLADWQAIFDLQNGCCPICNKPFDGKRRAVVDHQHAPPHLIRGLLCDTCNRKLNEALLAYLANPPAAKVENGPLYVPEERERARIAKLTARKEKAQADGTRVQHAGSARRKGKRPDPSTDLHQGSQGKAAGQVAAAIDHLEGDLVNDALAELDIGERVRRAMSSNGYAQQIQAVSQKRTDPEMGQGSLSENRISSLFAQAPESPPRRRWRLW